MKKRGHITGFYLETLLLIVAFIAIILVLTSLFGMAKAGSSKARILTNAVTLAGNAAEAVSASGSDDDLLTLLNDNGNAEKMTEKAGVTARYDTDMHPDPEGKIRLDVTWVPESAGTGTLVHSDVLVYREGDPEPIYTLGTAVFIKEAGE